MSATDALRRYREKRNFTITPEPQDNGDAGNATGPLSFVIQKHWASHLHYDFRLELDGSMKSWAVPKGPSLDSKIKRMAMEVEDHPISYNQFEGEIPAKQYGAGTVIIWDRGTWTPIGDPHQGYIDGNLKFSLDGEKLHGKYALIRMKGDGEAKRPWLLIKEKDAHVRPEAEFNVTEALPDSVAKKIKAAKPATAKKSVARKSVDKRTHGADLPAMPEGAVAASLPQTLSPQLATLVSQAPADAGDWIYEIKFDGYRLLARIDGDDVQLLTRNGIDWTAKMPRLVAGITRLGLPSGWLDGEIVVMNAAGVPDFQSLQNAFDGAATDAIVYYVFDLPYHAGHDLREVPLLARRQLLATLLKDRIDGPVRYSEAFDQPAAELLASSRSLGMEGVIGKRVDAPYVSRRSPNWIKLKCHLRQEFVIGGYTDPKGARDGFGSLLLGVHDASGQLQYAGNVGTGFNEDMLEGLHAQLVALSADISPFAGKAGIARGAHWVQPSLLAEVSFAGWTTANRLRHAVFHALRTDKPAVAIIRERPQAPTYPAEMATGEKAASGARSPKRSRQETSAAKSISARATATSGTVATTGKSFVGLASTLRLTHPEKIIDAMSGTRKVDIAAYYAEVAPLMMPHLHDRPTSLVRAPDGVAGQLFFQKHAEGAAMAGVALLDAALDPGHAPLLKVARPEGFLAGSQMNVLEYHTWNALDDEIGKPDRMTFDLDPGEGVAWRSIQESAILVRALLTHLGLQSFLKTSGGKGLHVVVPLKRRHDWDTIKDFSHAIVDHLAATIPQRFVARSGPANRVGKIFVDYLRNGFGATTACAWTTRARPGIGISVPLDWTELEQVTGGGHWTIANVRKRFKTGNTPWDGYDGAAQSLTAAMRKLGFVGKKPR